MVQKARIFGERSKIKDGNFGYDKSFLSFVP